MNFLGLTFLNAAFLLGAFAAAIPLIIHLSRSRRTKKMRFSTTRFFTDQFLRSYRMSRLKEWFLLLCRMALFGLLATALAQPFYQPRTGAASLLSGGPRAVVLVIDNSASMSHLENGQSLLDRAKKAADEVLKGLAKSDTASVVLAARRGDGPEVLFPEPTGELGDVSQAVAGLQVATLGTDLRRAVLKAGEIAGKSTASSKEVYILSDLQDAGWELPDGDNATAAPEVNYTFVRIRPETPANVAVTAIQFGAARPMVGVPFTFRLRVAVQSGATRALTVRLFVDGQMVTERRLDRLAGGAWASPRFYHTFTKGGWHSGYVEVDDPVLPQDNRRYFALEVLDSIRVLAVNGAPSRVPAQSELFFLKAALTVGLEGKSSIQVDEISPAELGGKLAELAERDKNRAAKTDELPDYPLVILANVEALPAGAVEKLEAFVERGRSLLVFLGDRVNPTVYNTDLVNPSRLHGGLMPARLRKIEGDPKGPESFAYVSDVDYDHAALSAFQDPRFVSLTGTRGVNFRAFWGLEPTEASGTLMRVLPAGAKPPAGLATPDASHPLLCEKMFGKGRVMLFASTCDRDWTNFPVRPSFLPWTHRLVGYLSQEPMGRQVPAVTGFAVPLPASSLEGTAPLGVEKPDRTIGFATPGDGPEAPLVFRETTQAGVYKVLLPERKDNPPLLAVNLEGIESNLTYLDDVLAEREDGKSYSSTDAKVEASLQNLMPGGAAALVRYMPDEGRIAEAIRSGGGRKLWDAVLWVVLFLALFEPWLANQISLRHYARPRDVAVGSVGPTVGRAPPLVARPDEAAPAAEVSRP